MEANMLAETQQDMNTCSGNIKYDEYQDQHWSPYCYDLQQSYFPWYNHSAPGYYYHRTPPEAWCNVPVYTYPHSVPTYKISGIMCENGTNVATNEAECDEKGIAWKLESKSPTPDAKWQQKGNITFGLRDDHTVTPMDISPRKAPFVTLKREVDRSSTAEKASKKSKFLEISQDPRGHVGMNASSHVHNDRHREKRTRKVERKSKVALEIPLSPIRYSEMDVNCHGLNSLPLERSEYVERGVKSAEEHTSAAIAEMRLVNSTQACRRSLWGDEDYPKDPRKRPLECNTLPRALKLVRFQREDCISKSSILDALNMETLPEKHVQNVDTVPASSLQQSSKETSPLPASKESDTQSRRGAEACPEAADGRSLVCTRDSSFHSSSIDSNPSCVNGDGSWEVVQCVFSGGYEPVCNADLSFCSTTDVSMNLGGFILEEPGVLSCHLEMMEDGLILCFD